MNGNGAAPTSPAPIAPMSRVRRFALWLGRHDSALALALAVLFGGALLAAWAQRDFGSVTVERVTLRDTDGAPLSGQLYLPRGATAADPRAAVLAVHGYINSAETQAPFAIELARRGIVVLALDQRGHAQSAPPAFAHGFGAPAALLWLRTRPEVDRDRIGLLGHSMGGWAVLAAAARHPGGYRSMALVGSAPDVLGAPAGTAAFPRNVAVVFARYDEFAELMWGADAGRRVARSAKLRRLFDSGEVGVVPDRDYGEVGAGTARIYHMPTTTHPGEHFSAETVGVTVGWLQRTLGVRTAVTDQVWPIKEYATLVALLGGIGVLTALPLAVLRRSPFAGLKHAPQPALPGRSGLVFAALLGAGLFLPAHAFAALRMPVSARFPQELTNGLIAWLASVGIVSAVVLLARYFSGERHFGLTVPGVRNGGASPMLAGFVLGALAVAVWLGLLMVCEFFLEVDFRFWIVAFESPALWHWPIIATVAPATIAFFVISHAATCRVMDESTWLVDAFKRQAFAAIGGFLLFLALQYGGLFAELGMPFGQPLLTIVALRYVAMLLIVAFVHAVCYRATGTVWLGAVINGLWVAIAVVTGTATHYGPNGVAALTQ